MADCLGLGRTNLWSLLGANLPLCSAPLSHCRDSEFADASRDG
jgi:hypothetical protein